MTKGTRGGNNIPESHLRKFALRGGPPPDPERPAPQSDDLARFIRDQL